MSDSSEMKMAVLIDADNVPYAHTREMLDEIAKYGLPTVKRIYGDFTKRTVSGWKSVLMEHAIQPVQQYAYTRGKNATDTAMIIDAMDLLHSGKVNGFCLVSSDSDFTRLAMRIRESGLLVIGMGERKTPESLIAACDKFIYLEILGESAQESNTPSQGSQNRKMSAGILRLIKRTVADLADENAWAPLAAVGALLNKKKPDFDPRNYGYSKLTDLFKSLNKHFEVDVRSDDKGKHKFVYVRLKD